MQPLTHLGKYTILARLGQGAFGVVYRAHDPALDRDVALKVLHPFLLADPEVLDRFWREARAMARLHHPGIVPIYEIGQDQGFLFLAERYVPGPTLEKTLADGPLPPDQAIALTEQLAAALDYAHGRGFLHRDVKPANIILDEETGQAVLTDFGLARALESSGGTTGPVGTPAYIPPEVWEGELPDARTDVYALAVVAYEMLAGRVPFDKDTPAAAMRQHLTQEPPFPPELGRVFPLPVQDVLRKGLAKRREDRYPSAGALAADLCAAAKPPEPPLPPPPPPEPPDQEGKSKKPADSRFVWAGIAALGLGGLVLCCCVVLALVQNIQGPSFGPSLATTTATATRTPMMPTNTAVQVVTPAPTRTPTIVSPMPPTVTHAPSPAQPSVIPTKSSSATVPPSRLLPAVNLLEPASGAVFDGEDATIVLRWTAASRALASDEYYVVTVPYMHQGQTWNDGIWTKSTSWTLSEHRYLYGASDDGKFSWYVTVMRKTGTDAQGYNVGVAMSDRSATRTFTWRKAGPGPEPTTTKPTPPRP